MNKYKVLFLVIFFSINMYSQDAGKDTELRTLVTLLDYISKDYSAAVEDREVINEFEYAEMKEFLEKALRLQQDLSPTIKNTSFQNLHEPLQELEQAVANKKETEEISRIALSIKNKILGLGILKITPDRYPSLKNGAALYQQNCVSCHGGKGYGDGALAENLNPAPTNFHEAQLSPLQAYNVIKLGIEGTAMASYNHLSEKELWDLSFYVLSLKHEDGTAQIELPAGLHLDSISKWNDEELQTFLNKSSSELTVGAVRNYEPERPEPLDVALNNLDLSFKEFQKGNNKIAEKYALTSYLEGVELVENMLNASAPSLVRDIERDMISYRKALQNDNSIAAENYYNTLKGEIRSAESILAEREYSFAFIYGSALSILIREALEALLIILIILSVLKPMEIKRAVVAVHSGWILAVAIGVVSWFFVDSLINLSGASRELMEGVGAILAVLVLIFAGVWLHSHSEISKWKYFIEKKLSRISETGNVIGLFIFSFIVVAREAFEVVLFLSSLKLSNPDVASPAIGWAILTSIVIIAVITIVFLKVTKDLPIGKFFKLASYMIAALAVILAGKGIMAFQEAGYISVSPVDFVPRVDLLGIYPNLQTISAQLLVLLIVIFFHWRNQNQKSNLRSSKEFVPEE